MRAEWASRTIRVLIFDNVEEPGVVEEWRPTTGGCRVLITSRCADWPPTMGVEPVPLATLPRDKAVELLCKERAEALERSAGAVTLRFPGAMKESDVGRLAELVRAHKGSVPLFFRVRAGRDLELTLRAGERAG